MPGQRVSAVWELMLPEIREYAGVHLLDGRVQDLSPSGVAGALAALGGAAEPEAHDEAHLSATEAGLRATFGLTEHHRWNPYPHIANLDLTCYERSYAPAEVRQRARVDHAREWPAVVDAALESLTDVPADVARCLLPPARGLDASLETLGDDAEASAIAATARDALGRLVARLEDAAENGAPAFSLGGPALSRLLGDPEAMAVDLGRLEEAADSERNRLLEHLREDCARHFDGAEPRQLLSELTKDHPDPDGISAAAASVIDEATAFCVERGLLPELGGSCLVGPAPPARRSAMAMMSWTGPYEEEAPAWYYVTPPDPSWSQEAQEEWLEVFSATTLPVITVHEVTPGHFAHGRMLCRARGDVRRSLFSISFVEGWAHYAEELMLEEGFRSDDPRFAVGVWVEALVRVTRFAVALGIHGGSMTLDEARHRFEDDALLSRAASRGEADRALYDPTYGRYTWGKLEIRKLRDEAKAQWGRRYSHGRFHEALLSFGAPPLGTIDDVLG